MQFIYFFILYYAVGILVIKFIDKDYLIEDWLSERPIPGLDWIVRIFWPVMVYYYYFPYEINDVEVTGARWSYELREQKNKELENN